MNKFKPFNPVNIQVKKIKNKDTYANSLNCHYCKFLLESCKCDDKFFYDKFMSKNSYL